MLESPKGVLTFGQCGDGVVISPDVAESYAIVGQLDTGTWNAGVQQVSVSVTGSKIGYSSEGLGCRRISSGGGSNRYRYRIRYDGAHCFRQIATAGIAAVERTNGNSVNILGRPDHEFRNSSGGRLDQGASRILRLELLNNRKSADTTFGERGKTRA